MPEPLTDDQITDALADLPGWSRQGDKLHKHYKLGDFREALAFIVRIGLEAEERSHHPELFNVYSTVKIDLCTHDAGDKVTQKDVDLAQAIEKVSVIQ
ncbi:4a-hydroxytetrahydrobiopterin dehydratase [Phycisphaeraceae bacterium D3-23]